jgi:cytochrome c biogenesis protein CcmG/thiol:disulfide interchange protein DsbE
MIVEADRQSGLKRVAFVIVPLVFVGFITWATLGKTSRVEVGDSAPDFTAMSFEGERIQLSQLRGRPVFINFWASWCIPCIEEAPDLRATYDRFKGTDLVMLGVNSQDFKTDAERYLNRHRLEYPSVRDPSGKISSSYGVRAFPESFFISRSGTVEHVVYGPMTAAEMKARIDNLLSASAK